MNVPAGTCTIPLGHLPTERGDGFVVGVVVVAPVAFGVAAALGGVFDGTLGSVFGGTFDFAAGQQPRSSLSVSAQTCKQSSLAARRATIAAIATATTPIAAQ